MGGTWDLFRYPGIRSDSDLFTFGFSFRPWKSHRSIADGASIRRYIEDTAREAGIDRNIRFGHTMTSADWDSQRGRWSVEVDTPEGSTRVHCRFLYMCTGYYDYDQGYAPTWPGMDDFEGRIVHPQHWPDDLDWTGQRIVVIGSGATAVTLVPELTDKAEHVTMLQRSPTYIVERPADDAIAQKLIDVLGERRGHALARWKNVLVSLGFYQLARARPAWTRKMIQEGARKAIGRDFEVERHLNPSYDPWDQRLCLDKDGHLFAALRSGRASMVTDTIECFTRSGIMLRSGEELEADLVITATGLRMQLMGGAHLTVDGRAVDLASSFLYKGMMLSDIPNLAVSVGYTNASWTLKSELIARYVARLLNYMGAVGVTSATPRVREDLEEFPAIQLSSGYVQRARSIMPKQGPNPPWRLYQNYILDNLMLGLGPVDDPVIEFDGTSTGHPAHRRRRLRRWLGTAARAVLGRGR